MLPSMAAGWWPPRPFYSHTGPCLIPAKESQASVRWPGRRLWARPGCLSARGTNPPPPPGGRGSALRIAGCPEPGGTIPCRSGTSSCRTRDKRPVWPAGRSSRSPAEGSASPAWCDTSGNRPAYPTPLLGNLEPAVLLPKHTHFEGVVKGVTPRMGREYEYWRPLYVRTCSYEYLLRPPEPRSAIVTQDAHERAVFPVGAAALPVFRPPPAPD